MFLELRKLHSNGAIRGYQLGAKYFLTPTSYNRSIIKNTIKCKKISLILVDVRVHGTMLRRTFGLCHNYLFVNCNWFTGNFSILQRKKKNHSFFTCKSIYKHCEVVYNKIKGG